MEPFAGQGRGGSLQRWDANLASGAPGLQCFRVDMLFKKRSGFVLSPVPRLRVFCQPYSLRVVIDLPPGCCWLARPNAVTLFPKLLLKLHEGCSISQAAHCQGQKCLASDLRLQAAAPQTELCRSCFAVERARSKNATRSSCSWPAWSAACCSTRLTVL